MRHIVVIEYSERYPRVLDARVLTLPGCTTSSNSIHHLMNDVSVAIRLFLEDEPTDILTVDMVDKEVLEAIKKDSIIISVDV